MKSRNFLFFTIFCFILWINCNALSDVHEECPIILSRTQWRAEEAFKVYYQTIPVGKIILIWLDDETCRASFECRRVIKRLQNDHMIKFKMPDIVFNFLIDDNGFVYEGCGWHKSGFHTTGHNRDSLGIAFIGSNKSVTVPSDEAMLVLNELIECGIRGGKISEDYKVFAQRQLCYQSKNPSDLFYSVIQELPHWSSD